MGLVGSQRRYVAKANGRRYDDLDKREVWELLRTIGGAILNDTYRIGKERVVKIPKDSSDPSRGIRPISLINIEDRVVQRTATEVLSRILDPLFGRNILGYRPGHGRLHALALAEQQVIKNRRNVFVVEDIRDAFTHVPLKRLLEVLAIYIPSDQVLQLLSKLLDTGKKHGIRQGGPLSPLFLNLYLHHFLDQPWRKEWPEVPMIRVADDLLIMCQSKKEAMQAWSELEALLRPANMPLKRGKDESIHNLKTGDLVNWLGFNIHKDQQGLKVQIAEKAWKRLAEHFALAHEKPDAAIRAMDTINGWIDQMGPCYRFVSRPRVYKKLVTIAAKQAFDEIPSRDAVVSRWRRAYQKWCDIRNEVKERPEVLDSIWAPPAGHSPIETSFSSRSGKTGQLGYDGDGILTPQSVAPWEEIDITAGNRPQQTIKKTSRGLVRSFDPPFGFAVVPNENT